MRIEQPACVAGAVCNEPVLTLPVNMGGKRTHIVRVPPLHSSGCCRPLAPATAPGEHPSLHPKHNTRSRQHSVAGSAPVVLVLQLRVRVVQRGAPRSVVPALGRRRRVQIVPSRVHGLWKCGEGDRWSGVCHAPQRRRAQRAQATAAAAAAAWHAAWHSQAWHRGEQCGPAWPRPPPPAPSPSQAARRPAGCTRKASLRMEDASRGQGSCGGRQPRGKQASSSSGGSWGARLEPRLGQRRQLLQVV